MSLKRMKSWQLLSHQNWVRTVLINQFTNKGDKVCQFFCKDGLDLGKWDRAMVSEFVGVDPRIENVTLALSNFENRSLSFSASFLQGNVHSEMLKDQNVGVVSDGNFDCVAAFDGLDRIFVDELAIGNTFKNINHLLKVGGYFFGIFHDSSELWAAAQKSRDNPPHVNSKLFNIQFVNEFGGEFAFSEIGTPYDFRLDEFKSQRYYMIHFPTLIRIAREYGLEMVTLMNCLDFFEDFKIHYEDMLIKLGVFSPDKKQIHTFQREAINLFTTFVFQKITDI
eukprot:TRINITY_DN6203_c0_g1_i1.p1 TRINITY_DN6203_c0_g1~~TRINITY_DN6203_c0_g1_i1.p1  ORF type:complete len:295 (+),score=50.95 TRINITY_DN6203_c0_g1_i1:48-887(+)